MPPLATGVHCRHNAGCHLPNAHARCSTAPDARAAPIPAYFWFACGSAGLQHRAISRAYLLVDWFCRAAPHFQPAILVGIPGLHALGVRLLNLPTCIAFYRRARDTYTSFHHASILPVIPRRACCCRNSSPLLRRSRFTYLLPLPSGRFCAAHRIRARACAHAHRDNRLVLARDGIDVCCKPDGYTERIDTMRYRRACFPLAVSATLPQELSLILVSLPYFRRAAAARVRLMTGSTGGCATVATYLSCVMVQVTGAGDDYAPCWRHHDVGGIITSAPLLHGCPMAPLFAATACTGRIFL